MQILDSTNEPAAAEALGMIGRPALAALRSSTRWFAGALERLGIHRPSITRPRQHEVRQHVVRQPAVTEPAQNRHWWAVVCLVSNALDRAAAAIDASSARAVR
jgi:hypothetical protein